jgi:Holliday junction DNA helicase RuvA
VSSSASWRDPLHAALLGLGWSAREADEAVATAAPLADDAVANGTEPDIALLLRSALRSLSRA